jgi:hypothetical protein
MSPVLDLPSVESWAISNGPRFDAAVSAVSDARKCIRPPIANTRNMLLHVPNEQHAPPLVRGDPRKRVPPKLDSGHSQLISFESNQILDHAAKISSDSQVTDEDKPVIHFETSGGSLLPSPRINIPDIHLQAVKGGIALGRLALFENLLIKLLNQQHGCPTGKNIVVSG